jgi:crossover junction endodeoxyribonuclease RuvC
MHKIVGIDPGLAETGVGFVSGKGLKVSSYSFGFLKTTPKHSLPARLETIYSGLISLLKEEKPELMVIEDIFSLPTYPHSAITLGKVTGVILLAACRMGITVKEIPVREAKQVLTQNGNASKDQLEKAVRHLLNHPEPIKPYHASDALALALIGLYRR